MGTCHIKKENRERGLSKPRSLRFYFGGKSSIADDVWSALGDPAHYIEPFFGSGAVLLNRPGSDFGAETICDADGFVSNVWRALQADPDAVAKVCDWPVNHADLIARKKRLIEDGPSMLERLCADDAYFDVKLAGYWIWAASCWIGSGMTCPNQIPHVGDAGRGVHAKGKRPHVSNAGKGVHAKGQRPHVSNAGKEAPDVREPYNTNLWVWFRKLSERLRNVRVVCGDWKRVCGGHWQDNVGVCGVFFDPPYGTVANRDMGIYYVDSESVAADVQAWCRERGPNPNYRIVLAGYFEEHESLITEGWTVTKWSASGGYSKLGNNSEANRHREALFFSPHCLGMPLFGVREPDPMLMEV